MSLIDYFNSLGHFGVLPSPVRKHLVSSTWLVRLNSSFSDHPARADAVLASIRMEAELQQLQGSASGVHGSSKAIPASRQPEILDPSGLQTDSAKALAVSGPNTSLQASTDATATSLLHIRNESLVEPRAQDALRVVRDLRIGSSHLDQPPVEANLPRLVSGNPKLSVPSLHSSQDSTALKKDVNSAQNVYGLHNSSLVQDGSLSAPDPLLVPSGQVPHVVVGTKEQLQPTVRTDNMNAPSDYSHSLLIRGSGQSFPAPSSQPHMRDAPMPPAGYATSIGGDGAP